jgi:glyoxylase-like metal-dependent hydrolase (beta-lactamase superfamily II)/rhodanese-related sulfurtransferase
VTEIVVVIDEGLGNSSYLLDGGDGRALVLDAQRNPAPYFESAERRGLKIVYAVETHLHADFVSGSSELAAQGARVLAPAAAQLGFPHRGLGDGDEVDLGGLTLEAIATPGHTPEHLAYLVSDGNRPAALFTGGSLLVGGVARTDLIAPERTEELARSLWRSLQERILTLPDDLPVYPTHGPGSFCSAPSGSERTTTIGREKAASPLLRAADEDAFVTMLQAGLGSYPPYFLRLREVNRRGPVAYGPEPPVLVPRHPEAVRQLVDHGAALVDARPVSAFAARHVPGSLSIPLRDQFATWLGWLVDLEREIVFVLDSDQDRGEVVRQALKVGHERLAGELAGGIAAWEEAGLPVGGMPLVAVGALGAGDHRGMVLDIRQSAEFAVGHVPEARHIELGEVLSSGDLGAGPITVMCNHGERAVTAASLLAAVGRHDVTVAVGGPDDWAVSSGRRLATGA